MDDEKLGLFKELPGGLRRRQSQDQEWVKAKETLYYQWFRCLNASKEYLECCKKEGKGHELADTYALFGNVDISWAQWWQKTGRALFSERRQYPKVRVINSNDQVRKIDAESKDFVILDIPLNVTRVTLLKQINDIFDQLHPGKDLKIRAQSSAQVLLEDTKLQHKTIPLLTDVAEILYKTPDIQLYQLAQKAKLAERHLGRSTSESLSEREERQRREMAASNYKKNAERLVYNAARLKFPSIE